MFAYGIAASRLRFGLGVDAPLEHLTAPVPLQPFVEYHAEIVTASADPAFAGITGDPSNRDQHWLTFGLRARVYRGLTLGRGRRRRPAFGRLRIRPAGAALRRDLRGVVSRSTSTAFSRPVVVTRTVEKRSAADDGDHRRDGQEQGRRQAGRRRGGVVRRSAAGARRDRSRRQLPERAAAAGTGRGGGHRARASSPRPARRPWWPGRRRPSRSRWTPRSRPATSAARSSDRAGKGVAATLRFIGATTFEAHADATGAFSAALPAGPVPGRRRRDGAPQQGGAAGHRGGAGPAARRHACGAPNPDVTLTPQAIVLRVPIRFKPGAPKLAPGIKAELDGVADLLARAPRDQDAAHRGPLERRRGAGQEEKARSPASS